MPLVQDENINPCYPVDSAGGNMSDQATLSGADHLDRVVEAHAQFLCNNYRQHHKKFQNLSRSDPEAAKAEAAIFALLKKLRLNPEPNDNPGTGGPDFICRPEDREPFVVEVTSLSEDTVAKQSNLPKDIEDQWAGRIYPENLMKALRTKISNKAGRMSNHNFARVLVVTTTHQMSELVLDRQGAEDLLTSTGGFQRSKSGAPVTRTTDLKDSIFIREEDGQIAACRKSISAILLVCISYTKCHVFGILHPEPAQPFDISTLAEVPFVRISQWPIVDGNINTEWVIDEPYAMVFSHRSLQCNQTESSDQNIQKAETPLAEVERFWQERTLAELTLEQGVRPIHRLEEVLGKGEGLWKDAEEFESFVHGIHQRRKED